jgi:Glycosyl transferases group 1
MIEPMKPKLVFFQFRNDVNLSEFVLLHRQQHIKCLSEFFNVTVISEDCDYRQICDLYQPDLTLFESGVNYTSCHRLKIHNTHSYPEIPKIGFHNGDSWCEARAGFMSDMEHWGIETFFSISTTTAEYTPEISNNLFSWPNFIDSEIFRDYSQPKVIPVLFTGYMHILYPWRQEIKEVLTKNYPSLICPHPSYVNTSRSPKGLFGEQYARTINASWFVPTCGTVAKEVVRKHLEIPAAKACLITEKTPAIEAAGFIDMQNCVFADGVDVLEKLDYLFRNQDELKSIIDAGYLLVHSQHTLKHRDQIFQWYNLQKNLKVDQKIIQHSPFGSLCIADESSKTISTHIHCDGLVTQLLRQGDEKLRTRKYKEAEALYLKAHNFISWMPEPLIRLVLCRLYTGNTLGVLELIPIRYTLVKYGAIDPDPVEWAYFIIVLICKGKIDDAEKCANQFSSLSHSELDRVRWVVSTLKHRGRISVGLEDNTINPRYSLHQLPVRSFNEWINELCIMLQACKQFHFAKILRNSILPEGIILEKERISYKKNNYNKFKKTDQELFAQTSEAIEIILEIYKSEQNSLDRKIKNRLKILIKINILGFLRYYSRKRPILFYKAQKLSDQTSQKIKKILNDDL